MTTRIGSALAVLGVAVALTATALGRAPAAHAPAVCPRFDPAFRLEFGAWGGPGTPLPKRELFAAAVTRGSDRAGGHMIWGSATPTKATVDPACRPARLAARPIETRLSKPYTYRVSGHSGWVKAPNGDRLFLERVERTTSDPRVTRGALAVSFKCVASGPVTVAMTNSGGGTYFTVRIRRELYATAAVRPNDEFTFRVSNRCERDQ
ncbi:MAG: hypothetical protein WD689_02740 [Gaiellaceae bacterium]